MTFLNHCCGLTIEKAHHATIARFTGHHVILDELNAHMLGEQIEGLAQSTGSGKLLVDFRNVTYLSSVALAHFIRLHKRVQGTGGKLVLCNVLPAVYEVFDITRLVTLFDVQRSDAEKCPALERTPSAMAGVLVVDDEGIMRDYLTTALQKEGFAVWTAPGGREAFHLYRQHHEAIDVLLLDVLMPGLDGPQTLAALRVFFPDVVCCFMSGGFGGYSEDVLLKMDAAHIFRKPFAIAEATKVIRRLTRRQT